MDEKIPKIEKKLEDYDKLLEDGVIDDQVVATVMGELDGIMSELETILQDKLNNLEEE
jgi:hypothetical protein